MKVISIDGHPRQEELADYVADTLPFAEVETLEAHVLECSLCASRLQRAARLQMVMHEAAVALAAPNVVPLRRSWLRRHVGAVSALWTAAAALALVVVQQGSGVALDAEVESASVSVMTEPPWIEPAGGGCTQGEPGCPDGRLASVDPLQSVDPLSTWPDDGSSSPAWSDDFAPEGEPCGSGEDGGQLVCRPFSG